MAGRYDVSTAVEYQDANGETKTRWSRIGVAWPLKDKDGFRIILDALPVSGECIALPPKLRDEHQQGGGRQQRQVGGRPRSGSGNDFGSDDDI